MGRLLIIELLEVSNIPHNIRHISGLKVKPYIKARCPASEEEKETSVAEDPVSSESSTRRWETSLLLQLQPVQVQREVVELSLFIKRTIKKDKLVATLAVPVADFAAVDENNSSASEEGTSRTYEMKFVEAKFGDSTAITMKICARVDNNAPPIPRRRSAARPRPVSKYFRIPQKILNATADVLSTISTLVGLEQALPDDDEDEGNDVDDDERNDDDEGITDSERVADAR